MKFPCPLISATAALFVCTVVSAQTPPSAGALHQQVEEGRVSREPEASPALRIESGTADSAGASGQQKVLVNSLRITGARMFSETQLIAVAGLNAGRELALSDLHAMAARITGYYRDRGYPLSRAYLPAQESGGGEITIAVLEGEYGQISLRNQSRLSDGVTSGLMAGLRGGDTIALAPLETRLLLLSDIPGIEVRSTLVPGASVGAADLIVDVAPGRRFGGNVTADSLGDRYTGEYRLGGTLNLNNPSGHGDVLGLRALISDANLFYARAAYQLPFGRLTTGVAYSHMQYRLGREFASLDADGRVTITSLHGSYPLLRSRRHNLYARLNLEDKKFRDEADAASSVARKTARVAMVSLNGDVRDGFGGGGWNAYSLTWSSGELSIRSAQALAADAMTARSNGHYNKLSLTAARLQHVSARLSLYASVNAQLASGNLDSSEKLGLGGASGISGYPVGEAYGDEGYMLKLEARTPLHILLGQLPGQLQLVGFADSGRVTLNKDSWGAGRNHRTLHSIGAGLNWMQQDRFTVSANLAHRLGHEATSAPDRRLRFWLQAARHF